MSQFLNRKKTRESLIQYFKLIAKCQKQIQSIQQKLVSHPRFNPIIMYKKIAGSDGIMTVKDLREYLRKKIGNLREQGIKMYLIKCGFQRNEITCQMFLQTLLPYTPNCLRDVNQTILHQLQTQHLDMTAQQIYHQLIIKSTESLYLIRLLQRFIPLNTWQKVQQFIAQDLMQRAKRIDLVIKEEMDVIYIRKWMELYTEVNEYQVLNLVRFFNGGSEYDIIKIYDNGVKIELKCSCPCVDSQQNNNELNQDYFKPADFNKNPKRIMLHTMYDPTQNIKSKSLTKNKLIISQSSSQQIIQAPYIQTQKINFIPASFSKVSKFLMYLTTFIQSQKYIELKGILLQPYKKYCDELLNDLLSKKKNYTKVEKILLWIQKFLNFNKNEFEKLLDTVGSATVENSAVFSLFSVQTSVKQARSQDGRKSISKTKMLSKNQIFRIVSQILHKFIQTRVKLSSFSAQFIQFPLEDLITNVLNSIDKGKKKQILEIQDLKEFLLKHLNKQIEKKYLFILMKHLGDGVQITDLSLRKAFRRQWQQKSALSLHKRKKSAKK